MALWATAWAGSKPIASVADGFLATKIGVRWTGILLALPAIVPILLFYCMGKTRSAEPEP